MKEIHSVKAKSGGKFSNGSVFEAREPDAAAAAAAAANGEEEW